MGFRKVTPKDNRTLPIVPHVEISGEPALCICFPKAKASGDTPIKIAIQEYCHERNLHETSGKEMSTLERKMRKMEKSAKFFTDACGAVEMTTGIPLVTDIVGAMTLVTMYYGEPEGRVQDLEENVTFMLEILKQNESEFPHLSILSKSERLTLLTCTKYECPNFYRCFVIGEWMREMNKMIGQIVKMMDGITCTNVIVFVAIVILAIALHDATTMLLVEKFI